MSARRAWRLCWPFFVVCAWTTLGMLAMSAFRTGQFGSFVIGDIVGVLSYATIRAAAIIDGEPA